jgi:hypothetical protein
MTDLYTRWQQVAVEIVQQKQTNWKMHPSVAYMLEHELVLAAQLYIDYLRTELSDETIQRLADLNDQYGGAVKQVINGISTSPSSIRYLRHSYDLCKHILSKNLTNVTVVEVGGGYGGLALIMSEMSKLIGVSVEKYIIYDLPQIQLLQQYYLSHHNIEMPIEWRDCTTFGSDLSPDSTNVLMSSYCISELPNEFRKRYLQNLLPKIKAALLIWNWGSKEDLPADRDDRPEVPDTSNGKGNTIIRL